MQGWFSLHKSISVIHCINKVKNKIYMIITIDAEKVSNKIPHPLMIQTFNKGGVEGIYVYIIKTIYNNPTASITLSESVSSKIRNKTRMSTHHFSST